MENNKKIILKGEGKNLHVLHGNFELIENNEDIRIIVEESSKLIHEDPIGKWSEEHKTLEVNKGNRVVARQVEFNPLTEREDIIWD